MFDTFTLSSCMSVMHACCTHKPNVSNIIYHVAISLLHGRVMPNGPDDRRFSAAGVLALTFGPPDGHIRMLMTQEKANKSRWRKKMVKRDLWRTMHPFNIPGENEPPVCICSYAFSL